MKATIKTQVSNGHNYSREKQLVAAYSIVAGGVEYVCARAYMGASKNASVVYATLWVYGNVYTSGSGTAGGYGYHKESQAFQDAIASAGIELWGNVYEPQRWNYTEKREYTPAELRKQKREDGKKRAYIGGVGESAMWAAFEAIARANGARGKLTRVSHA
jgi:hypothetical protein